MKPKIKTSGKPSINRIPKVNGVLQWWLRTDMDEKQLHRLRTLNNWERWGIVGAHCGEIGKDPGGSRFYCIGETKCVGIRLPSGDRQIWSYALLRKQREDSAAAIEKANEEALGQPWQGAEQRVLDIMLPPKKGKPKIITAKPAARFMPKIKTKPASRFIPRIRSRA